MRQSERHLMARILVRDAATFELLLTHYSTVVRHHLQHMMRDTAAAEDLVQEVFLRVWPGVIVRQNWPRGQAAGMRLAPLYTGQDGWPCGMHQQHRLMWSSRFKAPHSALPV